MSNEPSAPTPRTDAVVFAIDPEGKPTEEIIKLVRVAQAIERELQVVIRRIDAAQAEAAQNAKDAERYRYIRGVHWAFGEPETDGTFSWKLAFHGCAEHLDSEEAMDVAIDAAIGVLPAAGKAKP